MSREVTLSEAKHVLLFSTVQLEAGGISRKALGARALSMAWRTLPRERLRRLGQRPRLQLARHP